MTIAITALPEGVNGVKDQGLFGLLSRPSTKTYSLSSRCVRHREDNEYIPGKGAREAAGFAETIVMEAEGAIW
jgi:hypothetical protein